MTYDVVKSVKISRKQADFVDKLPKGRFSEIIRKALELEMSLEKGMNHKQILEKEKETIKKEYEKLLKERELKTKIIEDKIKHLEEQESKIKEIYNSPIVRRAIEIIKKDPKFLQGQLRVLKRAGFDFITQSQLMQWIRNCNEGVKNE